ncbi:MAG TPA: hypothetical protein VFU69_14160 [Ktedonobacterales bacterium]|nr:hypothetical protein [Ktedonobacterales bacterium]
MTGRCFGHRRAITPDLARPGMGLGAFYHRKPCPLDRSLNGPFLAGLGRRRSDGESVICSPWLIARVKLRQEGAVSAD